MHNDTYSQLPQWKIRAGRGWCARAQCIYLSLKMHKVNYADVIGARAFCASSIEKNDHGWRLLHTPICIRKRSEGTAAPEWLNRPYKKLFLEQSSDYRHERRHELRTRSKTQTYTQLDIYHVYSLHKSPAHVVDHRLIYSRVTPSPHLPTS
jgi:hypothetical protein